MVKNKRDFGYEDRRRDVGLEPTGLKMDEVKKELIRASLEFPIVDIVTFTGYKGDAVTKITTLSEESAQKIEAKARDLGFEVNTTIDPLMVRRIHCISQNDIYGLK